jgi:ligand-binding sensor domain-containing protein
MRHDGSEWHPLVPAIQEANLGDLSGEVNVLMRASSGDLWVASEVGLFRLTGGVWQRYGEDRGVGTIPVRGMVEAYGALWIASDKGLLRYDADNDRWQRIVIADDRAALTIGRMSNDSLMVGSWDELFESNDQGQTWQVVATIASGQLVGTPHVFINDRAGRLWVGTATGLSRFDRQAWKKP